MRARAPASSANLGPGYDALGLALSLHLEVTVEPASRLEVSAEGEGADLVGGDHLALRVVRQLLGHDSFALHVASRIPLARGLGSSAALAAAAAAAAGAEDPLAVAAAVDGHAENAAASVLGGLVAATLVGGRPLCRELPLDPGLAFVVVVPDRPLPTAEARAVLPATVPLEDATHNLGRLALLLAGLADRHYLVAEAGEDRLHQPWRTALFPEAPELLARLRRAGAAVATWSGAGPSLLAICQERSLAPGVARAGEEALDSLELAGEVLVLEPDLDGIVVAG